MLTRLHREELYSDESRRASLLGLVRHLTEVEAWFHDFDGDLSAEWYSNDEDPDACFNAVDPARADEGRPVSLRWVYLHMIEEYARHNGHADLLRERIDGVTGD